jgi:hypothetical protein
MIWHEKMVALCVFIRVRKEHCRITKVRQDSSVRDFCYCSILSISDDKKDSQDCYDFALKKIVALCVLREYARCIAVLRFLAPMQQRYENNDIIFHQKRKI